MSDEKRRSRARKAAPDDEAEHSREHAEAARRAERAPPVRLRDDAYAAVSAIAAKRELEFPEALHQVLHLGIRAQHEGWEQSAVSLSVWRELRDRCLAELHLTEGEASLICDVLNGAALLIESGHPGMATSPGVLFAELEDSFNLSGLDRKWGVDRDEFLRRARLWTSAHVAAINEAAARFWAEPDKPTSEQLRAVGLVREQPQRKGE